jgi:hypothetical protein
MKENETFNIEGRKELFRVGKISTVEILAIQTQINFNSLYQTETLFNFILEHIEVSLNNMWVSLKEKGREVYMPLDIQNDYIALQQLCIYFIKDYLQPLFKKSEE